MKNAIFVFITLTFVLTTSAAFGKGSYGTDVNNYCPSPDPYSGDCTLCHTTNSKGDPTEAIDAYKAGNLEYFCPAPVDPNAIDDDGDGYSENQGDCNDTNFSINPDASEVLYNGIDENCNGMTDDVVDADTDGFNSNVDCNDTNPSINPGATEILSNGIDENCNGMADDAPVITDTDNDGVIDDNDNCPNTPTGTVVDANGCALPPADSDNDGVIDDNDNCPNTPASTVVDANGCALPPADSDNDGVIDDNDNCPLNANANQVDADNNGLGDACDGLLDSDSDGITDSLDNCPSIANPDQLDTDVDSVGDLCEEGSGNTPPEITSTPTESALEGELYSYQFTATDPDDDALTLSAMELPEWLTFSTGTGELQGTPDYQDAGEHTVTLQASDDIVDTEQTFTVTVVFDESDDLDVPELTYQTNGANLSVTWTAVPGAQGYVLSYAPYPYNGYDVIQAIDVGNVTNFGAELWDGAAYMIAVRAKNSQGDGEDSEFQHFTIGLAPPEPPVMSYEFTGNVITISWTADDTAGGYLLSYAPSPYLGPETIHSIDMGDDTSVQYTIPAGSDYYIAVQAYNAMGDSTYSNIEQVSSE